jgi:hypothetical protein
MGMRTFAKRESTPKALPAAAMGWQRRSISAPYDSSTQSPTAAPPDLQAQLEIARHLTPNWSQMKIGGTPSVAQPKLTVGAPNDQYEQEADRVAAQVMNTPDAAAQPAIQRETVNDEELHTKPLAASITPLVQREMAPTEEEVQPKLATAVLQREAMSEEENQLQPKPLATIQREAMPEPQEDEDQEVQPKSIGASI